MRITSDALPPPSLAVAPAANKPAFVDFVDQQHPTIQQAWGALLPLGIWGVAFVTIAAAYDATFRHGLLDFQHGKVVTPPISMLMFAGPGRRIGQIGFPAVSLLFGCCVPRFFRDIEQSLLLHPQDNNNNHNHKSLLSPQFRKTLWLLKMTSSLAFMCLAIVGLIPLQSNLPEVMYASSREKQTMITWDSIVHQVSAGFFFLLSMIHMGLWLRFTTRQCPSSALYHYQKSPASFYFKVACFVLCFVPLPTAFLLHPISPLKHRLALTEADAGGITQYALVACVASFFASYSYEMWYLPLEIQQQQQQQQQEELHSPKKHQKKE